MFKALKPASMYDLIVSLVIFFLFLLFAISLSLFVLGSRGAEAAGRPSTELFKGVTSDEIFTDDIEWYGADHADFFMEIDGSALVAVQASPDGEIWVTGTRSVGDFDDGAWVLPAVPVTGEFVRLRIVPRETVTMTAFITIHGE